MFRITLTLSTIIFFIAATRGANGMEYEDDLMESLGVRYDQNNSFSESGGLSGFVIAIIAVVVLILPIICCCCCCCACCPCYHWCHPNNTNVTIIQPSSFPGPTMQNHFDCHGSSVPAFSQGPPPEYSQKGYGRLTTPAECV